MLKCFSPQYRSYFKIMYIGCVFRNAPWNSLFAWFYEKRFLFKSWLKYFLSKLWNCILMFFKICKRFNKRWKSIWLPKIGNKSDSNYDKAPFSKRKLSFVLIRPQTIIELIVDKQVQTKKTVSCFRITRPVLFWMAVYTHCVHSRMPACVCACRWFFIHLDQFDLWTLLFAIRFLLSNEMCVIHFALCVFTHSLATCCVRLLVGNWRTNDQQANYSLLSSKIRTGLILHTHKERKADNFVPRFVTRVLHFSGQQFGARNSVEARHTRILFIVFLIDVESLPFQVRSLCVTFFNVPAEHCPVCLQCAKPQRTTFFPFHTQKFQKIHIFRTFTWNMSWCNWFVISCSHAVSNFLSVFLFGK